jgi:DNA-binding transcriptional ArsR family regulator
MLRDDKKLRHALAHPTRRRILRELDQAPSSATRLAGSMNMPLGNVSYHVQTLAVLGALKSVDDQPMAGAIEYFYRADIDMEPEWVRAALDPADGD